MPNSVGLTQSVARATPFIRKVVVAVGLGLTMASLRFDIIKQLQDVGANYWGDWATRGLLVTLLVICTGLLIATVLVEDDRFLASVSGFGTILLGFFLFIPVAVGFSHQGDLVLGAQMGVVGSALIVLGAAPTRALFSWTRSRGRNSLTLYSTWLAAVAGAGIVIVSLGREITNSVVSGPNSVGITGELPRYWTSAAFSGGHTLGIVMLALAIIVIALAAGDAVLRAPVLGRWALAASLLLLGFTTYYPFSVSKIGSMSIGAGLGLEGAALASLASLAAVAVERGALESRELNLGLLASVGGIGLALAGTYTYVFSGANVGSFWVDGTLGAFPLLLIVAGILFLLAGSFFRLLWCRPGVSIAGWLLLGFYGTYVFQALPNHLGMLGPATGLGMGGAALMALSTISRRSVAAWKRRSPTLTLKQLVAWLAAAIGIGVAMVSLWLATEAQPPGTKLSDTYWNSAGDRSQGIVMLALGVLTLVALLGVLLTRLSVLRTWALGASLVLLGTAFFIPVIEAFKHLGTLRSGAWLALVGSLVAAAGAAVLAVPDQVRAQEDFAQVREERDPTRPRVPLKGKKHRVPEMRQGR